MPDGNIFDQIRAELYHLFDECPRPDFEQSDNQRLQSIEHWLTGSLRNRVIYLNSLLNPHATTVVDSSYHCEETANNQNFREVEKLFVQNVGKYRKVMENR